MPSAVYNQAQYHFGIGEITFTTASRIWIALCGNSAPTKTHAHYSEIAGQLAGGSGYTVGGNLVTPGTVTIITNVAHFDAPDATFTITSPTITPYFAIAHWGATGTGSTNPLLAYYDLGGPQAITSGTLTLQWNTNGLFTSTSAAES